MGFTEYTGRGGKTSLASHVMLPDAQRTSVRNPGEKIKLDDVL